MHSTPLPTKPALHWQAKVASWLTQSASGEQSSSPRAHSSTSLQVVRLALRAYASNPGLHTHLASPESWSTLQ